MEGRGPDAKHSSTKACELILREIFPKALFFDLVVSLPSERNCRSLGSTIVGICCGSHDVGQVMVQLFGVGVGRTILRGVAKNIHTGKFAPSVPPGGPTGASVEAFLADRPGQVPESQEVGQEKKPAASNSTRPIAYGHRTADSLIHNYVDYYVGFQARLEYSTGQTVDGKKRGRQSIAKLIDVGSRLAFLDFVVFLLFYADFSRLILRPFSCEMQPGGVEAVEMFATTFGTNV